MKRLITALMVLALLAIPLVSADESTQAAPKDFVAKVAPVAQVQLIEENRVKHCYQADESYALYHNGLWWAWLAPVAQENWVGQGIDPDPSLIGDGWREVSGEEEWALRPEASTFESLDRCAAKTFFPPAPFCNWNDPYYTDESHPNGYLTYYLDGSVAEYWVVHDDCGIPNDNEVPEFGMIGAALVLGLVGLYIYKRRK